MTVEGTPTDEHEQRLAKVLYDATTGADHPQVPWSRAVQGMWLADAARILGDYQSEYAETMQRTRPVVRPCICLPELLPAVAVNCRADVHLRPGERT